MVKGRVSSEESMGLVDGPGIRYVVFLQGCHLRCKYCHNPETWDMVGESYFTTAKKLVDKIEKYKAYFGEDGGVTFSGGEPLLQPEFLLECLEECKRRGINTAIDTAGVGFGNYDEILKFCDLVIVDEDDYKELTGQKMDRFKEFLSACQKNEKKLWLRQVIVPGTNDTEQNIDKLANFIKIIKNVERVELLPYKTMGEVKYKKLGLRYRLAGLAEMNEEECKRLETMLIRKIGE